MTNVFIRCKCYLRGIFGNVLNRSSISILIKVSFSLWTFSYGNDFKNVSILWKGKKMSVSEQRLEKMWTRIEKDDLSAAKNSFISKQKYFSILMELFAGSQSYPRRREMGFAILLDGVILKMNNISLLINIRLIFVDLI